MVERERFEDVAHVAEVYQAVVGYTPVWEDMCKRWEGVEILLLRVSAGICSEECRNQYIRRSFLDTAYLGVERLPCMRVILHESATGVVSAAIAPLYTLCYYRYIVDEVLE